MKALTDPVFKNYANFKGRSSKKEFWPFALLSFVLAIILRAIRLYAGDNMSIPVALTLILGGLLYFALLIPSLANNARRLHDTGRSGWMQLIGIIPFGGLVLLYFYLQDSEPSTNEWGPNPERRIEHAAHVGLTTARNDW